MCITHERLFKTNTRMKFSILIPTYNVERYIERCLASVSEQTYRDYEIIIIDDGSIDRTYDICACIIKKYENIRLYKQENKGVAITRNSLLSYSKGEWIIFIDSDDYVENNFLEQFSLVIDKNKSAEIVCCDHYIVKSKGRKLVSSSFLSKTEYINGLFKYRKKYPTTVWAKAFKRELIDRTNMHFELNINMGEDICFLSRIAYYAQDIIHIPFPLYNWNSDNENSMCNVHSDSYYQNRLDYCKIIEDFYKCKSMNDTFWKCFYGFKLHLYRNTYLSLIRNRIYDQFSFNLPIFDSKYLSIYERITESLIRHNCHVPLRINDKINYIYNKLMG